MAVRREALERPQKARLYRFPDRRAAVRRIERRRRVAGVFVVIAATAGLLAGGGPSGVASADRPNRQEMTLRPGQTLWEVAVSYAPEGIDPRAFIGALLELNGLEAPPRAGTVLLLPN